MQSRENPTRGRMIPTKAAVYLVALGSVLVPAGGSLASAQPARANADRISAPGPTNAALIYNRYFTLMGEQLPEAATDPFDENGAVRPEAAEELAANQHIVEGFLRASRLPKTDFGIERHLGFSALVTHLGQMRAAARLLCADAQRLVAQDNTDENAEENTEAAADRVVAVFAMGRALASDRTLVSTLTGFAVLMLAADTSLELAGDAEAAARLTRAIESVDRDAPVGVLDALRGEAELMAAYEQTVLQNAAPGKELARVFREEMGVGDAPVLLPLVQLGHDEVQAEFRSARAANHDLAAAWSHADPLQQIRLISHRIAEGEYGQVALLTSANAEAIYQAQQRLLSELDAAADKLAGQPD